MPQLVDWVGTSMGGLIGLGLASLNGSPVRKLVLNDVGPAIEPQALQRIGSYLGQPALLGTRWTRRPMRPGRSRRASARTRREQWLALTRAAAEAGDAATARAASPRTTTRRIAVPFRAVTPELAEAGEAMLWQSYDRLRCPTLLLRGADSDLLSRDTAQAMTQRGPRAQLHEFAGVGHAPTLVHADQIEVLREFLLSP